MNPKVFIVQHDSPEVLAYAMAKYSRSAKSLQETILEISQQKSSEFLNTFYFEYGHRSIADMAHIALALEHVSLLAAIDVVDEQRWDGQERSTRYQDFSQRLFYTPQIFRDRVWEQYYATMMALFDGYEAVSTKVLGHLLLTTPDTQNLADEKVLRTLKARAFDVARYLLPLSTLTSLGQITSGRTLEGQISRLRSSPLQEIKLIGDWLAHAATDGTHGVPTLVKYAEASEYQMKAAWNLQEYVEEHSELKRPDKRTPSQNSVTLLPPAALETELAISILYPHCQCGYEVVRQHVESLTLFERKFIFELALDHRGRHDELLRGFQAGQALQFEILMDVGGYRDLHRHRKTVQLSQRLNVWNGFDKPDLISAAGCDGLFADALTSSINFVSELPQTCPINVPSNAQYAFPLAARKRAIFKMDLAQAVYMTELRSKPGGHFSYRRVAWQMAELVKQRYPYLSDLFARVVHPDEGNILER